MAGMSVLPVNLRQTSPTFRTRPFHGSIRPRNWQPHEKPSLPGSPSTPLHSNPKRLAYALVGVLVAVTGGLGNSLVVANLPYLQGALGATTAEMAWLPAAFVMTNVSMNLLLVKFRQQFGLRAFTEVFLVLYALVTFGHLFVNDLNSAIGAGGPRHGRCGTQFAGPVLHGPGVSGEVADEGTGARPGHVATGLAAGAAVFRRLAADRRMAWPVPVRAGLALLSLGCVLMLKLPPGDRFKTFEPSTSSPSRSSPAA
jgi:hypothetical protein